MTAARILETPPDEPRVTAYDLAHKILYLRLLDAAAQDADWRDVARIVLGLDPDHDPDQARRIHGSHLARARWITEAGYRDLLRQGSTN
ncbi:DNA -binding domain-containing protein [Roseomonas fluvialis]|uniref:T6SS Transcription factor RovC-like DNA binding domain-containing protein n=1 Tax=Roseomonas fluvialis TaxID=1750527 RepID=A0ABN6P7K0_9PROT|nr:DUF2285 domain-containing protein [Roseomonas fluvialis]BDG74400.1 hypothetical protein Rmf_43290 [Roseomonas fluvialis]